MGFPLSGTFLASAARTTSGSQELAPGLGDFDRHAIVINVTAVSGTTPTLDFFLEDSVDGTIWPVLGTTPQITAAGVFAIRNSAAACSRMRLRWVIGGTTPSFTFSAQFSAQRDGT
jgi:hypothetical protein